EVHLRGVAVGRVDPQLVGVEPVAVLADEGGLAQGFQHGAVEAFGLLQVGHPQVDVVDQAANVVFHLPSVMNSRSARAVWPRPPGLRNSSGAAASTTRPPPSPPSGPMSTIQSASAITSRLCSMRTTLLPASTRRCSTRISFSTSAMCRPTVGSSST